MTHSTRGGGRAKAPDMAADKSKQHNVVTPAQSAGTDQTADRPQATAYRGSGPGTHGGGGGGTPARERAPSAKGSSNRGKGSGPLGH